MEVLVTRILTVLALGLLATASGSAGLTDPYAIVQRYYKAAGGLAAARGELTTYYEGTVELEGTGVSGTIREWRARPGRFRQEADLTIISQVAGDNGRFAWEVNTNGKVQEKRDERSLQGRRLAALVEQFDHIDPKSKVFRLGFAGVESVAGDECYVVRRTNNLNSDTTLEYFRTGDFELLRTVEIGPEMRQTTTYSDYRVIGAVRHPFRMRVEMTPPGLFEDIVLTRFGANIPYADSLFEPPGSDAADYRFENGDRSENVPFQLVENHIYLPVTINGRLRNWVLDTGAGMSVIDSGFARELGLALDGDLTAAGAGGTAGFAMTDVPGFSLPGIEFGPQKMMSLDLAGLFKRRLGTDVVGILGYDFLSRFTTRIDFANRLVSFYRPESLAYSGTGSILDAPIVANVPTVTMTVDGRFSGKWRFDIGAAGSAFNYPFAEANGLVDRPGPVIVGAGVGGAFRARVARYDSVQIAGFTVPHPVFAVPFDPGSGALGSGEYAGIVGNDILRHFIVYLDYADQRIILERGRDFDREFAQDRSGLSFGLGEGGELVIEYVTEGTSGAEAGFMAGDILLEIDGRSPAVLGGVPAIRELLRGEPGTAILLKIRREGRELTVPVRLRDPYAAATD